MRSLPRFGPMESTPRVRPLPIDPVLPEILARLHEAGCVVVEAPPGAGKTTRVPPAILDAGLAGKGEIVVLEPRRLAARMAARRVAEERGERVGETVGVTVRFEDVSGPRTRLRFVTEGVLSRRLVAEPALPAVGCVVLDEFHERHLAGDVALAALRRLRETSRPDLRIAVMSATLDAEPVARFLGDAPRVRSEGRAFPVGIEHAERADERPLEVRVAAAVSRLAADGLDGDVLVFLPGAAEIRRATDALRGLAAREGLLVLPLHGDLPPERQDEAVRPAVRRKVVLATNVAETSITVDGVVAVVDSGLARVASHSPWSGLPRLDVGKVSRASAAQRAGRAGRTRPGRCLRLYTKADHDARPPFDVPEVLRADLAEAALDLRALGADPAAFPWFESPPAAALSTAEDLLRRLHAVDAEGRVTDVGRAMLALPLHPRLSRLVVEADRRGARDLGAAAAACLSERDLRLSTRTRFGRGQGATGAGDTGPSDVLALLDALDDASRAGFEGDRLRSRGIDPAAAQAVERVRRQVERRAARARGGERARCEEPEVALGKALLAAFPDRVAKRRTKGRPEILLCAGGAAVLGEESVVRDAEVMVAIDAAERPRGGPLVRIASAIEEDWLLEAAPERVREEAVAVWDEAGERAVVEGRIVYDALVLRDRALPAAGHPAALALLRERALAAGSSAFADPEALSRLLARARFVAQAAPESGVRPPGDDDVREALASLCEGSTSFAQVRRKDLLAAITARLGPEGRAGLAALAPERVPLGNGRTLRVGYAAGQAPFAEVPLQDLLGCAAGPSVAGGRAAVVLHLLGPNRRPVQVTADLPGFWARQWPAVRREMARRYPKHVWPVDPLSAKPPPPRARGRRGE